MYTSLYASPQDISRVSSDYDSQDAQISYLKKLLKTEKGRNHGLTQRIDELDNENKDLEHEIDEIEEDRYRLDKKLSAQNYRLTEKLEAKDDWMHKLLELSTAQHKHMTASYSFQDTISRLVATLVKDVKLRCADNCGHEDKIALLEEELRVPGERLALVIDERLGEPMDICEPMDIYESNELLGEPMDLDPMEF